MAVLFLAGLHSGCTDDGLAADRLKAFNVARSTLRSAQKIANSGSYESEQH
jgi:hypothetical protein